MMQKMKKSKLGFTLLEMLVVIAIVAVLVSVIVPMASSATIKANAATNAANLRSIEGQLTAIYMQYPYKFKDGQISAETVTEAVNNKISEIADEKIAEDYPWVPIGTEVYETLKQNVLKLLGSVLNDLQKIVQLTPTTYYAQDGVLTLDDGTTVNTPQSKAVNIGSITMEKNIEMTVVVSGGKVIATYDGMNADCFAAIAEMGKSAATSDVEHTFRDTNEDGICDICGSDHDGKYSDDIMNDIDQADGNAHECYSTDGDHTCDKEGCYKTLPCQDKVAGANGYCDHKCDMCGATVSECNGSGGIFGMGANGCTICGKYMD